MKRLLSTNASANKRTYFHSNADVDRVVTEMDVTSIQILRAQRLTSGAEVKWLATLKSMFKNQRTFRCRFISSF